MPGPAAVSAMGRRVKLTLLHLLLGAAILPTHSAADGLEVGDSVRLSLGDRLIVGRVSQIEEGAFEVGLQGGGSYSVMRTDIVRLERVVTGDHARGGAIVGSAAVGLFIVGAVVWGSSKGCKSYCDIEIDGLVGMVILASLGVVIVGGAIGAAVGSAFKWTRWEAIPIGGVSAIPAIGLAVGGGRVGLELQGKLRF